MRPRARFLSRHRPDVFLGHRRIPRVSRRFILAPRHHAELVSAMTPNLPPARTSTPRIFLHLGRRVALLCTLSLLAVAGVAAALPSLPDVSQGINTPLGSTTADLKDGALDVCSQNGASTAMLPALPAVPALPVPVAPPSIPALPAAGIDAPACLHTDLSQ